MHEAATFRWSRRGDRRAQELHGQACELFHRAVAGVYPEGFSENYQRMKAGDSAGLASAVKFLEADPWFFRSGYIKAELIRSITRMELPRAIVERLQGHPGSRRSPRPSRVPPVLPPGPEGRLTGVESRTVEASPARGSGRQAARVGDGCV